MGNSLALFGLKQASLYEVRYSLHRGNNDQLQKDKSEGGRPPLARALMEEGVVPCSSSEAASLLSGVDYKCIDKRYETVQSQESLGFPE